MRAEISIIVPVFNEASLIQPFLHHLRERALGAEIIVVDGGSSDATVDLAQPFCTHVVTSAKGRAEQMNTGARVARGDVFWFLHADSCIPDGAAISISEALEHRGTVGGFFRIRLPSDRWIYRVTDTLAHYLGLITRIRFGDHGIFCQRATFEEIGGFPTVPLMEDVEFYRALRHRGRVFVVSTPILTSPRRFEQAGAMRLTLAYALISALYLIGVPLRVLHAIYQRTCTNMKPLRWLISCWQKEPRRIDPASVYPPPCPCAVDCIC